MNHSEYSSLLAEINTVTNLLERAQTGSILQRKSFESRLRNLKEKLSHVDILRIRKKAIVTFRGKPVDKSQGITADFSGKAIEGINEMVATVVASLNKDLKDKGPIPNRFQNQLMITGTAVGSFGFEFELPEPDYDVLAERSVVEEALSSILSLLGKTSESTDDDLLEVISSIHPRAVKKISDFLIILQKNEALFAIEYESNVFRIKNESQLDTIINRLDDRNIRTMSETYQGKFVGFLPKSRTFEFSEQSSGEIIKGKVDSSISDTDFFNLRYLHKLVGVSFNVVQFGQSKPKYTLSSLSDIYDI